jgi:hypothetical protein
MDRSKLPFWPAALRLDQAAAYCGLSPDTFKAVCPVRPIQFTQSRRWLKVRLDVWPQTLDPNDPETGGAPRRKRRFGESILGRPPAAAAMTRRKRNDDPSPGSVARARERHQQLRRSRRYPFPEKATSGRDRIFGDLRRSPPVRQREGHRVRSHGTGSILEMATDRTTVGASRLPCIDWLMGGRYTPAIRAFFDREHGVHGQVQVRAPDGPEDLGAWSRQRTERKRLRKRKGFEEP